MTNLFIQICKDEFTAILYEDLKLNPKNYDKGTDMATVELSFDPNDFEGESDPEDFIGRWMMEDVEIDNDAILTKINENVIFGRTSRDTTTISCFDYSLQQKGKQPNIIDIKLINQFEKYVEDLKKQGRIKKNSKIRLFVE
jgi:hypothetical protein